MYTGANYVWIHIKLSVGILWMWLWINVTMIHRRMNLKMPISSIFLLIHLFFFSAFTLLALVLLPWLCSIRSNFCLSCETTTDNSYRIILLTYNRYIFEKVSTAHATFSLSLVHLLAYSFARLHFHFLLSHCEWYKLSIIVGYF